MARLLIAMLLILVPRQHAHAQEPARSLAASPWSPWVAREQARSSTRFSLNETSCTLAATPAAVAFA